MLLEESSKMSKNIFVLDKYEKRILKFLALKGALNLSQLSEHAIGLARWGVSSYLYGSPTHMGLIPHEYVSVTPHNKKENKYQLTTKGILASIGIVPLKSNTIFQKYVAFVSQYLPTKRSNEFIKKCVTEFMELILAWHYLNGINLTKQKYSNPYYMEFFDKIKDSSSIMINHLQRKEENEFFKIMKNCITNVTIIDLLTSGKYFKNKSLLSVVDWKKTKPWKENITNEYFFGQLLWEWPNFLCNTEITLESKKETEPLSKYYAHSITEIVKENLTQIEAKIRWKSELDSSTRKLS